MNTAVYPYQISGADINVTPVAQQQMSNLMVDMEENIQGIRIFVTGGGCSGMTYAMTFANTINDYDSVLECEGFKIIVDPIALNYLQGCEIGYANDGLNQSFVFNNVFKSIGGSGACGGCGGAK